MQSRVKIPDILMSKSIFVRCLLVKMFFPILKTFWKKKIEILNFILCRLCFGWGLVFFLYYFLVLHNYDFHCYPSDSLEINYLYMEYGTISLFVLCVRFNVLYTHIQFEKFTQLWPNQIFHSYANCYWRKLNPFGNILIARHCECVYTQIKMAWA